MKTKHKERTFHLSTTHLLIGIRQAAGQSHRRQKNFSGLEHCGETRIEFSGGRVGAVSPPTLPFLQVLIVQSSCPHRQLSISPNDFKVTLIISCCEELKNFPLRLPKSLGIVLGSQCWKMSKCKRRNQRQRKKRKLKDGRENFTMDWAGLPGDILVTIFEQLSLMDCLSVDSVCKRWSNVLAELPKWKRGGLPWLLMSGQKDREMRTCDSMLDNRIWEIELLEAYGAYVWGSFQDWLILVKDLGCYSLEVSFLNPFSARKINLPRLWNFYHKMVLSGSPAEENTICAAINSQDREIAFWVQGSKVWHKHRLEGTPFADAVFCNGSFFLLCNDSNIFQIDATSVISNIREDECATSISEIKAPFHEVRGLEINSQHVLRYLVEASGEVLLICRYFSEKPDAILETINFEIYSLDLSQMSWEKVEALDAWILFLGKCCSRSLSSTELGIGISNRIYFSNDDVAPWWNEWDSNHLKGLSSLFGLDNSSRKDWGTFLIDKDNNGKFCFRGNRDNWAPIWFTAPLWWYSKNIARQTKQYRQI